MKKTVLFIAAIAAMLVLGSCIIIPYNEIAVEAEDFELNYIQCWGQNRHRFPC
jgi:hypothetical protein